MSLSYPGKSKHQGDAHPIPLDVVIANPPFGAVRGEGGANRGFDMGKYGKGYATNEIDHAIPLNALDGMKDGGRAVLILGGPSPLAKTPEERGKANTGKAKRNFYAALYGAYNVVDHFTVSGDL